MVATAGKAKRRARERETVKPKSNAKVREREMGVWQIKVRRKGKVTTRDTGKVKEVVGQYAQAVHQC